MNKYSMAEKTMTETNHLALIAHVNEDIKRVVKLARKINLLALNAILLSRRAGHVALGFGVIADELRVFSKSLTLTMQTLMTMSYASVQTVSRYQRNLRMKRLMLLASEQMGQGNKQFAELETHSTIEDLHKDLQHAYGRLIKLLTDADDASRFGSVISRSLKIEATYGSDYSNLLAQVAMEFGQYIDSIPEILTRLERQLKNQT